MKLGIYSGNSGGDGGFSDGMSLNQAFGFIFNCCDVTIVEKSDEGEIIPVLFEEIPSKFELLRIKSENPIKELRKCDWVVWNTYRREDEPLRKDLREAGIRITKSFPSLFGIDTHENENLLNNRLDSFDFLAFGLYKDFQIATSLTNQTSKFGYVPRGFVSNWLPQVERQDSFKIAVDAPVKPRNIAHNWKSYDALKELDKALLELKENKFNINVVSSRVELPLVGSTRLGKIPVKEFYKQFFASCNLYIGPPMSVSRHSESVFLGDSYRGQYENQVVEAQIVGALVLGEKYGLIDELLAPSQPSHRLDFQNKDEMVVLISDALMRFDLHHVQIASWAIHKHDAITTTRDWLKYLGSI